MERTGKINGTIDANPNPVLFGQGNVVIWWETNDPTGGKVRVSTSAGDEKLVSKSSGQSGRTEIPWIVGSTVYDFRLRAASKADAPVDSVQVRRAIGSAPIALRELSDEIGRGNVNMSDLPSSSQRQCQLASIIHAFASFFELGSVTASMSRRCTSINQFPILRTCPKQCGIDGVTWWGSI